MRMQIIILLVSQSLLAYKKISMFVGIDPDTNYGFEIKMYPDLLLDYTMISGNDFSCIQANHCVLQETKLIMEFMGQRIIYYQALAQLNLIKQPFSGPYMFRFIANDTINIGSWVSVSPNSTYLSYLYTQDQVQGYRIIFRLDWQNTMIYKTGVFEGDKILLRESYPVKVSIQNGKNTTNQTLNFCLNNRLDMTTPGLSVMGVPENKVAFWDGLLKDWQEPVGSDLSQYYMVFSINDHNGFNLGNMTFYFSNFTVNNSYRIKSFNSDFDDGRNCDLYTGSLMLLANDFKYYYVEYDAGYDVRFSMENFVLPPPASVKISWGVILNIFFFVLIALIVGVIVWRNSFSRRGAFAVDVMPNQQAEPLFEMRNNNGN